MSYLNYYTCATCHGSGSELLFEGLLNGNVSLTESESIGSCFKWPDFEKDQSFSFNFRKQWIKALPALRQFIDQHKTDRWSFILASTKGLIEDEVWQQELSPLFDPYESLLQNYLADFEIDFKQSLTLSNACASSHGALQLGQKWLRRDKTDHVLVLAIDVIGPFIASGFSSLRARSETEQCIPFDDARNGLLLGDGMGVAIISKEKSHQNAFVIEPIENLCESFSVTRPDTSGSTLAHCMEKVTDTTIPSLMIAHGTATYYNDITEAGAFEKAFENKQPPFMTATKWSVGHSLGASGLIDLNVACEVLKNQKAPAIHGLKESKLSVSEWLLRENKEFPINSVLITSLGFGGICSAMLVRKDVQ